MVKNELIFSCTLDGVYTLGGKVLFINWRRTMSKENEKYAPNLPWMTFGLSSGGAAIFKELLFHDFPLLNHNQLKYLSGFSQNTDYIILFLPCPVTKYIHWQNQDSKSSSPFQQHFSPFEQVWLKIQLLCCPPNWGGDSKEMDFWSQFRYNLNVCP